MVRGGEHIRSYRVLMLQARMGASVELSLLRIVHAPRPQ